MEKTDKIVLSPSLISLDDCNMLGLTEKLTKGGFDTLHVDIIDGYFSPDMPLGVTSVVRLAGKTDMKFDVHLMVNDNHWFVDELLKAKPYQMCFHLETETHPDMLLSHIKRHGVRAGVALKPSTPLCQLEYILERCDFVLVMMINPGYAHIPGETKVPYARRKLEELREMIDRKGLKTEIEIDGRISPEDIETYSAMGVKYFVAGSSCFKKDLSFQENCENLMKFKADLEARL
ncbi:MAG: ribulose-phosphate 3-epimerase [Christensenellaceae bacterium]|nr:ribulose-phosphate 3-epimerase [Christensenellaceae bacterium]